MTATPQPESKSPSRRALLVGALGGLGALAANAMGSPRRTIAHDPDDVRLGAGNSSTSFTSISNSTAADSAFEGYATGSGTGVYGYSQTGPGVWGEGGIGVKGGSTGVNTYGVEGLADLGVGVYGVSTSHFGVQGVSGSSTGIYGHSTSGTGIHGSSDSNIGVYGSSYATTRAATLGQSLSNSTGVQGYSGTGGLSGVPAKAKTGVYGIATQDSNSRGVWGESPKGRGIQGTSSSGYAGYFSGKVFTTKWYELTEIANPTAPGLNRARLFIRDNGSGTTQLCVRFANGTIQVLAAS